MPFCPHLFAPQSEKEMLKCEAMHLKVMGYFFYHYSKKLNEETKDTLVLKVVVLRGCTFLIFRWILFGKTDMTFLDLFAPLT